MAPRVRVSNCPYRVFRLMVQYNGVIAIRCVILILRWRMSCLTLAGVGGDSRVENWADIALRTLRNTNGECRKIHSSDNRVLAY
jgi:hypothetical protein